MKISSEDSLLGGDWSGFVDSELGEGEWQSDVSVSTAAANGARTGTPESRNGRDPGNAR